MITYSNIGVFLFSDAPSGEQISELQNFKDFPHALLLLLKIVTGDEWRVVKSLRI